MECQSRLRCAVADRCRRQSSTSAKAYDKLWTNARVAATRPANGLVFRPSDSHVMTFVCVLPSRQFRKRTEKNVFQICAKTKPADKSLWPAVGLVTSAAKTAILVHFLPLLYLLLSSTPRCFSTFSKTEC